MLPWGHLAVGYLLYTVLARVRWRRPPRDSATVALALGTQLPDLVDKPLNWWFGVFDGRGAAHSLLVITAFCALAVAASRRYGGTDTVGPFALGLYTHPVADAWQALLTGQFEDATFLVWPLLGVPTYPKDSISDHTTAWLAELRLFSTAPVEALTTPFGVQVGLFTVLVIVWVLDGVPGVRTPVRVLRRVAAAIRTG